MQQEEEDNNLNQIDEEMIKVDKLLKKVERVRYTVNDHVSM